jgi:hypothetical protein
VPLNGLMIAATPAVGGHHLADTLAGCALATVAIIFVRHARRADAPNVSSLRPMSDVRRSRSSLNSGRRPKA